MSVVYWEGEVFVWMGGLLFEGGCWQLRDSCVSLYVVFEVDERIFFLTVGGCRFFEMKSR